MSATLVLSAGSLTFGNKGQRTSSIQPFIELLTCIHAPLCLFFHCSVTHLLLRLLLANTRLKILPAPPTHLPLPTGGTTVSLLILRYPLGQNLGAPLWQPRQNHEWHFSALCGRSVTFGRGVAPPFFRHYFHTCSLASGSGGDGTFAVNAPNYPLLKKQRDGERQPALPGNYGGAPHLFATNTTPIKGS